MIVAFLFALTINGASIKMDLTQTCDQLRQRVDEVFTEEALNDTAYYILKDPIAEQLLIDIMHSSERNGLAKLESQIISKIESIELPTTTNTNVMESWVRDRDSWVRGFALLRTPYEGDEENFWRLCRLASTIKLIDCPMDLARRTRFIPTPENLKRREHQQRIEGLNMAIRRYRGAIIDICEDYITRASERMSDKEFAAFSNQVEKVVRPDKISRDRLFYDAEFKKRLRAEALERRRNR